ncbi:MAG: hypothetical protein CME64_11945 [Halobacteriovoraceae bacterium]|nr:hypothetical protein [Halobacteriovoraceae bacterium]|tara:strand:+ start:303221 stop:303451 length:231 start_codon:yes stop_codon:yes gene_type:complete
MHDRWEGAYYTSPKPSLDQVKNCNDELQDYHDQTQDPCHVFHNKNLLEKAPLHWGVMEYCIPFTGEQTKTLLNSKN